MKMSGLTEQEIREGVERAYSKTRKFCELIGFTKEQWIEEVLNPKQKLKRCENCSLWECDTIKNLKDKYPLFVKIWYEYGCACSNFILNTLAPNTNKVKK